MVDQLDRPLPEEETYLAVLMVGNGLSLVECVWKVVQKRKEDETGDAAALNEMRVLRLLVEKHFGCLLNSFADYLVTFSRSKMITREAEGCSKLIGFFVECGNAMCVDGWMQRMCLLCAPSGVERPNVEFVCCERSDHKWVDGRVTQPDSKMSEMFCRRWIRGRI